MSDLSKQLLETNFTQAEAAQAAIAKGWRVRSISNLDEIAELQAIYEMRANNLKGKSSAHAAQLLISTQEMLDELCNQGDDHGEWIEISGNSEYKFVVLRVIPSGTVVGCLRVVSKLDVNSDRWDELWGEDA